MNKPNSTKILIVEDEIVLQDVYKLILSTSGYDVYTAGNGIEGLKQLKAVSPDIILLDLFMPLMDGKEFLRNFNSADNPDTKVIVYTNMSDGAIEQEMLSLGAQKFVLKSTMSPKDLVKLVEEYSPRS